MAVHSKEYLRELACTQDQMLLIHILDALDEQNALLKKIHGIKDEPVKVEEVKEEVKQPAQQNKGGRPRKENVNG